MFAKKTVDSIVKSFSKAVADLQALAKAKADEESALRQQAAILRSDAEEANSEAARALLVSEKLSRLIGA